MWDDTQYSFVCSNEAHGYVIIVKEPVYYGITDLICYPANVSLKYLYLYNSKKMHNP